MILLLAGVLATNAKDAARFIQFSISGNQQISINLKPNLLDSNKIKLANGSLEFLEKVVTNTKKIAEDGSSSYCGGRLSKENHFAATIISTIASYGGLTWRDV